MKILLLGKNGQLGHALCEPLSALGEVNALGRDDCDLASPEQLRRVIRNVRPEVIVNAAAYTAVDRAESEVELARKVNADALGVIGEEANKLDAPVVHYSTDYLFDGTKTTPYLETDVPSPLNVYGHSKWQGELALQASGAKNLIFRTTWVCSAHGGNFLKSILRLAQSRETLSVVADQYGVPTSADLLARATVHVLSRYVALKNGKDTDVFPFGLYHLTAGGETTWFEYARYVVAQAIACGFPVSLAPEGISPISTEEYPLPARRPKNSRLDCSLFKRTFDLDLPDWRLGINPIIDALIRVKK